MKTVSLVIIYFIDCIILLDFTVVVRIIYRVPCRDIRSSGKFPKGNLLRIVLPSSRNNNRVKTFTQLTLNSSDLTFKGL